MDDREDFGVAQPVPALLKIPTADSSRWAWEWGTASEPPKPVFCSGTKSFPLQEDHTKPGNLNEDPHIKDMGPPGTVSLPT